MRSLRRNLRALSAACCAAGAALCLLAGSAQAATVYPPGGGAFNGGPEGWAASGKCSLELLLCTSDAKYNGVVGNPPGSLVSETTVTLSLLELFQGEFAIESPQFTVATGGQGTVSLQRSFVPGTLLTLIPKLSYAVTLLDKTDGTSQVAFQEETQEESQFVPRAGAVALHAGHAYTIAVTGHIASTVKLLGLDGASTVGFDNVMLIGPDGNGGSGGGGNDGGSNDKNTSSSNKTSTSNNHNRNSRDRGGSGGGSHLSNTRLRVLIRKGATAAPVQLRGNRLLVKVNCPAKVGRACRIVAQGMLNRRRAATSRRVVKVARGKGKRIVLHVKRKARKRVAKRKRLLVRQKVRAGKAHVTIYKSRKLIRRHPRR